MKQFEIIDITWKKHELKFTISEFEKGINPYYYEPLVKVKVLKTWDIFQDSRKEIVSEGWGIYTYFTLESYHLGEGWLLLSGRRKDIFGSPRQDKPIIYLVEN